MTDTDQPDPAPRPKGMFDVVTTRPRLFGALVLGLVVAAALWTFPNGLGGSTRFVLAWDTACAWFIGGVLMMMRHAKEADIRRHSATQDEGRGFIIALCVVAATAGFGAIVMELALAKNDHGLMKGLRVLLAFATVAASWLFVHMVFALHYAHEYYDDPDKEPGGPVEGGLGFPGEQMPDYWDFLHFALVIGVASQTADVSFTSKDLRRIGTVHALVSFVFNTAILALSINLAAGLF